MIGIKIDGKHTSDFGLIMTGCEIASPEPITHMISIPGRPTELDLTESIYGRVTYKPRTLKFAFDHPQDTTAKFQGLLAYLNNLYHGRRVKVIIDSDPGWYWVGRMSVAGSKDKKGLANFVLTLAAEPYKYAVLSTLDDWLWDSFSFRTGVIRNYKNLSIPESKVITVIGSPVPVTPKIKVSKAMTLMVAGKSFSLAANAWQRLAGVKVGREPTLFAFTDTGVVSIEFREESL